jgi:hypothetical protein
MSLLAYLMPRDAGVELARAILALVLKWAIPCPEHTVERGGTLGSIGFRIHQ